MKKKPKRKPDIIGTVENGKLFIQPSILRAESVEQLLSSVRVQL